jgi:Na+/melibiose symporter-like transporter
MVGALALGLALPLLQYLGFDSAGNNDAEQIRSLSFLYVIPPWILYASAVMVIWRYPITSSRLLKIRAAFDRRDQRRGDLASVHQMAD